jgi:hypothetical protein
VADQQQEKQQPDGDGSEEEGKSGENASKHFNFPP